MTLLDNNHSGSPTGDPTAELAATVKAVEKHQASPQWRVEMEIQALTVAASNLWKLRLDPATADEVLRQELDLWAPCGILRGLIEDVRASNDKTYLPLELPSKWSAS